MSFARFAPRIVVAFYCRHRRPSVSCRRLHDVQRRYSPSSTRRCERLAALAALTCCAAAAAICSLLVIVADPAAPFPSVAVVISAAGPRRSLNEDLDDEDGPSRTVRSSSTLPSRHVAGEAPFDNLGIRARVHRDGVASPPPPADRYGGDDGHYSGRLSTTDVAGERRHRRGAAEDAAAAVVDALREMKFQRRQRSTTAGRAGDKSAPDAPANKSKTAFGSPASASMTGNDDEEPVPHETPNGGDNSQTAAIESMPADGRSRWRRPYEGQPDALGLTDRRSSVERANAAAQRKNSIIGIADVDDVDSPSRQNGTMDSRAVGLATTGHGNSWHPLTVDRSAPRPELGGVPRQRAPARRTKNADDERKINGQFIRRRPHTGESDGKTDAFAGPVAAAEMKNTGPGVMERRGTTYSDDETGFQPNSVGGSTMNRSLAQWRHLAEYSSDHVTAHPTGAVLFSSPSSEVVGAAETPQPDAADKAWTGILAAGGNGDDDDVTSEEIPSIIHQTWDDLFVPSQVADWMRSWTRRNSHYAKWFWTDSGVRRLLQDRQQPPSDKASVPPRSAAIDWARLARLYDSYPHAIHRADVRKYIALYAIGGIVADLDTESLRPLDLTRLVATADGRPCILAREPELHRVFVYRRPHALATALFAACRPRHPFFRFVLDELLPAYAPNARALAWNDNVLNSTGPTFLSDAVQMYRKTHVQRQASRVINPKDDVFVAPADWFAPTIDPLNMERFRLMCKLSQVASVSGQRNETQPPFDTSERKPAVDAGRLAALKPQATTEWKSTAGSIGTLARLCSDLLQSRSVAPLDGNIAVDSPYTNHHWLHSWSDGFVARGGLVDVRTVDNVTVLVT